MQTRRDPVFYDLNGDECAMEFSSLVTNFCRLFDISSGLVATSFPIFSFILDCTDFLCMATHP